MSNFFKKEEREDNVWFYLSNIQHQAKLVCSGKSERDCFRMGIVHWSERGIWELLGVMDMFYIGGEGDI